MTDIQIQEQDERRIKAEAAINPLAAFMQLQLDIDRELRKLLVSTGALQRYLVLMSPTLPNGLKILSSVSGAKIPSELEGKISQFWLLRNNVVHSGSEVAALAFELGLSILRILRNVPRPKYVVRKSNLTLYSDANCRVERPDVKGVWLETFDADGISQGARIYPSTQKHLFEGMSVGWEWSNDRRQSWDETWYKHPDTGKCTPGWSGSMEFIGRDINQV